MPDYEIKNRNTSLNLMGNRLGLFGGPKPAEVAGDDIAEKADLHGLEHQEMLLKWGGGFPQQDRMILDKKRSLDRALKYSYQAATIKKVDDSAVPWLLGSTQQQPPKIRALMNPNKLKMDYDDKILSVPKEHGFKAGDVFEWENTGTKWLITLQDKTELAYFRGDVRRCNYLLKWLDDEKNLHECYAATRGPVETKINFIQKQGISFDTPNHSLNILMPKRKDVLEYFKRYSKFYLQSSLYEEDPENQYEAYQICFRVEAVDWVSTPGVFELTAVEYFANEDEDDIEAGLVGAKILDWESPEDEASQKILGPTFIKPYGTYEYTYNGFVGDGLWQIDTKKYPVEFAPNPNDVRQVRLKWNKSTSGQFEISYNGVTKTIVVQSLF